jgi:hypothetical protein
MNEVMLKLEISTLKGIVALCRLTKESLESSFTEGHTEPHDRLAISGRWVRVRSNLEEAERLLFTQESRYQSLLNLGQPSATHE